MQAVDPKSFPNQTKFRNFERKVKQQNFEEFLTKIEETRRISIFGIERVLFEKDGFFLIKNAIPIEMQKEITEISLVEVAKPPNVSNLDSHFKLDPQGIWNQFAAWKGGNCGKEPKIEKRIFEKLHSDTASANDKGLAKIYSVYDPVSKIVIDSPVDSMLKNEDVPISKVLNRLRWITIGHQYNWSTKEYHFDRVPEFNLRLSEISNLIMTDVYPLTGYLPTKWKAEAGIVNFYQPGDSLTAHQDRSEVNESAPLISISIGLAGVFLLGTENRDDEPIALYLESGDLAIMSGNARKAFHSMTRIIPDTLPEELKNWGLFGEHLSHSRINLNIRQVL